MANESKRLSWPDLCKGIAIVLVVIGHSIGYVSSYGGGYYKQGYFSTFGNR